MMRRAAPMDHGRGVGRALLALIVAAGLLASCSSSDGSTDKATRRADTDVVAPDWDFEATVDVTNASSRPIEIGQISQLGSYGEALVSGGTWKAAGDTKTLVVPAASNGGNTAGHVPIFIQMKDSRRSPTQSPSASQPGDTHEDVLLVLPTMQLRFQVRHTWVIDSDFHCIANQFAGNECIWKRKTSVGLQIRESGGFQLPLAKTLVCLDPTTVTGDVGDTTKVWNDFAADKLNRINVTFRKATDLADVANCWGTGRTIPNVRMPGMSFSDGTDGPNLAGTKLPEALLPGADFRGLNLKGASFAGTNPANLAYADFSGANLANVDFSGADLTGANFDGATIDAQTRFVGALLADVDLTALSDTSSPLSAEQLYGAGLCRTKLPAPPATTTTTAPEPPRFEGPNGICSVPFGSLTRSPIDAALVMTTSPDPLVLATGAGDLDVCPRASQVGPHMAINAPPVSCTTAMASQTAAPGGGEVEIVPGGGGWAGYLAYTFARNGAYLGTVCPVATMTAAKTCPQTVQPPSSP